MLKKCRDRERLQRTKEENKLIPNGEAARRNNQTLKKVKFT